MPISSGKVGTVLLYESDYRYLNIAKSRLKKINIDVIAANNKNLANKLLLQNNIDITITNLITTSSESMDFLSIAMLQNPEMERVVLCKDGSKGIEALTDGRATSFIADPWNRDNLEKAILHILDIRNKSSEKKVANFIEKIDELPVQNDVYEELIKALNCNTSFKILSEIAKKDVAVSARILKVANTKRTVDSIEKAITMILGSKNLKEIILTFENSDSKVWNDFQRDQLKDVSRHSYIVDHYFKHIYRMKFGNMPPAKFSSVALTHDIGKIIQIQYMPFKFEEIIANMKRKKIPYHESEIDLGLSHETHTELGARIMEKWQFNEANIEIAKMHHNAKSTMNKLTFLTEVVDFTDALAKYSRRYMDDKYFSLSRFHRLHHLSERRLLAIAKDMAASNRSFYKKASSSATINK